LGGQIAAAFGIRDVFFVTSALLLLNAVWAYFQIYKKLRNSDYAAV
jgi:DHA1 family multidrug resistance protein-like MFS transporter